MLGAGGWLAGVGRGKIGWSEPGLGFGGASLTEGPTAVGMLACEDVVAATPRIWNGLMLLGRCARVGGRRRGRRFEGGAATAPSAFCFSDTVWITDASTN